MCASYVCTKVVNVVCVHCRCVCRVCMSRVRVVCVCCVVCVCVVCVCVVSCVCVVRVLFLCVCQVRTLMMAFGSAPALSSTSTVSGLPAMAPILKADTSSGVVPLGSALGNCGFRDWGVTVLCIRASWYNALVHYGVLHQNVM